jgi:hypothetical protein
MKPSTKRLAKKVVAVIIVVAILQAVGVSSAVLIFFTAVGFVVWRIARRAEHRETQRVFNFYIAADEILRNDEREWYGFEVAEVIDEGDRILNSMPDPPALCYFAVGALCHRVGDYQGTVQHLTPIIDAEWLQERRQALPSPQLRRYVELLRELEREPALAPQALGATRSLARMRQKRAAQLLIESRDLNAAGGSKRCDSAPGPVESGTISSDKAVTPWEASLSSIVAPPPILEVLHDLYKDDQKTH